MTSSETHAVLRNMVGHTLETLSDVFRLAPELPPENPVPRLLELVEKTEAARDAELDALSAWFECVDDAE